MFVFPFPRTTALSVEAEVDEKPTTHGRVLILGGGVAGVIAARTLHEQGITNFTIVEARGLFLI